MWGSKQEKMRKNHVYVVRQTRGASDNNNNKNPPISVKNIHTQ